MTAKPSDLTRTWASGAPGGNIVDPDVADPGKFAAGWLAEIPPFEYFNFIQQLLTQAVANLNEEGIFEYDAVTDYPVDGMVKGSDGRIYRAVAANGPASSIVDPVVDGPVGTTWISVGYVRKTIFSASGNYNKPAGLRFVEVTVVGGGGGGGGSSNVANNGGGGGAGGGCSFKVIQAATLAASETVTIGAGGGAGTATTTGSTGGTSSFGVHASATGGTGGDLGGAGTNNALGGIGSGGDLNIVGEDGGPSVVGLALSSSGGSSHLGGGGAGASSNAIGRNGNIFGGGGGGGSTNNTSGIGGGAGAAGVVIVREIF